MGGGEFTQLFEETFDGGIIAVSFGYGSDGEYEGDIQFAGGGTMTSDELRDAAVLYESFPAWLRSMADRFDKTTGASS